MKTQKIKISDSLEITVKTKSEILEGKAADVYEYYIGRAYVFGVLEPFTISDLIRLYDNGYFNPFIEADKRDKKKQAVFLIKCKDAYLKCIELGFVTLTYKKDEAKRYQLKRDALKDVDRMRSGETVKIIKEEV